MYRTTMTDMEIAEPARVIFPSDIHVIAVKYNNSNNSAGKDFARYFNNYNFVFDSKNAEQLSSFLYYQSFLNTIRQSFLFDTIYSVEPKDFSKISVELPENIGSLDDIEKNISPGIYRLAALHQQKRRNSGDNIKTIQLDPKLGLYTAGELAQIKDSTGADLLLSLDYFAINEKQMKGQFNYIFVQPVWNFYNLKERKLQYFYNKTDTILWFKQTEQGRKTKRKEVVQYAAEHTGNIFAQYLVPHWVPVQRTFYRSGHVELKKAQKLAEQNKWLEAAKIWKKNANNQNKNIAAKSMYNLAVACEMEGEIDAAIDWVTKSYNVFGNSNEVHDFNCRDYLRLLGQRKLDIKKIEMQVNP